MRRPRRSGSTLPAQPRNVAVVRRALEAIAEELALPRRLIEDMRLAVTEACTNVVRHAYDDDGRDDANAMRVDLLPSVHGMEVIVEDRGRGLGPSPDAQGPGLGAAADRGAELGARGLARCR